LEANHHLPMKLDYHQGQGSDTFLERKVE